MSHGSQGPIGLLCSAWEAIETAHARAIAMSSATPADLLLALYGCIGRTDGAYGGRPDCAEVPASLAQPIIERFRWFNWSGKVRLMVRRGPNRLEFYYGGLYAEGRTRAEIYAEFGIEPWTTGDQPPSGLSKDVIP